MAVNPITSEELTINFADLLKIPVSDRVQAAMMSPDYANALLSSLTPIQMAKVFPDYYRRELPDISNFVLANRYLDDKGAGAFTQKGGGDYGEDKSLYGGKKTSPPPKTVVDKILEGARIYEATGKTGVTSAIKDPKSGRIVSTADVSLMPEERALLDTIAAWESPDYNTIVGRGGKFTDFSDHPRIFGTETSTAAGRYQFTKSTWDEELVNYNKENPNSPITDFSPISQDRMALYLAKKRYKANTGRDLSEDLVNPPENFDELMKSGLGYAGPGSYLTWEAFKKKNAFDIGNEFNKNLQKNTEYAKQEAEAAAKDKTKLAVEVSKEVMDILNSDPMAKKYFLEDKPEMGQKLQEQINAGILDINGLKGIVDSSASKVRELIQTTEQMAKIGGDAIVNKDQTRVSEQQEILAGTRKLPLQDELTDVMDYAAQKVSEQYGKNIYMKVFSGGQAALGTAGPRKGTTEHDLGGAADIYFVERLPDGSERTLSMSNPDDKKLMYDAAYHFARAGGRSVGIETGYMGDEAMHLGISRNDEDPVHHGDPELQAVVDQGKNEFLTEARNSGWDTRYGYKDFLEKQRAERIAAYEEQNKISATAVPDNTPQKTMVISLGTNDWADPKNTYQNSIDTINAAKAKGYKVVVVPPINAKVGKTDIRGASAEVRRAAADAGVDIEEVQDWSGYGGYHPSNDEAKRIAAKYPGQTFVGDSIANQIGTFAKDGTKVATDGINTSAILSNVTSDQVATNAVTPATPAESKAESVASVPTPPAEPVKTFQYGGSPETQDDENLSVYDDSGSLRFKMNSGEGIYVKPESEEYADIKIEELSGRLDEMSDRFDSQSPSSAQQTKSSMPRTETKNDWSQKVIAADRPRSPSADRANRRAKFLNEGWRAGGRSSPNSITS